MLKRESARILRDKHICNLSKALDVGVLYYLHDEATYSLVSAFVKRLQEEGKHVKALGYVESKRLTGRFLPRLSYDFLYPSGLSWNFKPVSSHARDFIETKFDILIDLSMEDHLPLMFLSGLSRAAFKVGLDSGPRSDFLDLMIKLPENGKLDDLIKHIHHYLSEINKENENKAI